MTCWVSQSARPNLQDAARHHSRPKRRVHPVELAQQARPFRAERRLGRDRELGGVLGDAGRRQIEGGVAGHRQHLRLAGELQIEHVGEGERDRGADREQAVVAQDHHRIGPEVAHQPRAFVDVDRESLIVVIADAAVEELRMLAERQQSVLHGRHGDARLGVGVDHAIHVLALAVNRAVDHESGLVHGRIGLVDQVAVEIDLDQVRRRHLLEQEPEAVEQEMPGLARHARRDVGVDQVGPAEMLDQSVAGREVDALLPFGRAHVRLNAAADGGWGHCFAPAWTCSCVSPRKRGSIVPRTTASGIPDPRFSRG